jgi:hypothetical protein
VRRFWSVFVFVFVPVMLVVMFMWGWKCGRGCIRAHAEELADVDLGAYSVVDRRGWIYSSKESSSSGNRFGAHEIGLV